MCCFCVIWCSEFYSHSQNTTSLQVQLASRLIGGPVFDTFRGHSQKKINPCSAWFSGAQGHRGCEVTTLWCSVLCPLRDFHSPLRDWAPALPLVFYSANAAAPLPSCHWNCLIEQQQALARREILIAHFLCFLNDLNCLGKKASILNLRPTRGDSHNNKV